MSIRFACPVCKTAYTVQDRFAGKKSSCKKCGQRVQVPAGLSPPPIPKRTKLGEALKKPAPPSLLLSCKACFGKLAKEATTCPTCGSPNEWIHPESTRFLNQFKWFQEDYPALVADAKGSILVISSTRPKQFMDYAANAVGGLGVLAPFSLAGIALALGASIGTQYAADELRKKSGPHTQVFMVDFRHDPPKWSSTNDDYWWTVIDFFHLRRRRRRIQ